MLSHYLNEQRVYSAATVDQVLIEKEKELQQLNKERQAALELRQIVGYLFTNPEGKASFCGSEHDSQIFQDAIDGFDRAIGTKE